MEKIQDDKKPEGSTSLRVNRELFARIQETGARLHMSANAFGVAAIEAILDLIDQEESNRAVPDIIRMHDTVKGSKTPFGRGVTNSTSASMAEHGAKLVAEVERRKRAGSFSESQPSSSADASSGQTSPTSRDNTRLSNRKTSPPKQVPE